MTESEAPPDRAPLYIALVHFPVYNRQQAVVATSITNLDVHDISRAARSYGLAGYFLVTPVEAHQWMANRIIQHWDEGWGATYNPSRRKALSVAQPVSDLVTVQERIAGEHQGTPPIFVATSCHRFPNSLTFSQLRQQLETNLQQPYCLVLGTGHGLHAEVLTGCDMILEPIRGAARDGYNYLSVRSAASIMFDRLCSPDRGDGQK
jgi:hypothetical protein